MKKFFLTLLCVALIAAMVGCAADHGETTTPTTEEPVTQAPEPASDAALYCEILQNIMVASDPVYGPEDGMLYDLDGNGTDELIVVYTCTLEDSQVPYAVCDVYTIAENEAIALLDRHILYVQAGGPTGSAGVANIDGKDYFYVTRELVDIGQDVNHHQNGKWELFSVEADGMNLMTEVDYSLVSRLDSSDELKIVPEESTASINGVPMTYGEYQSWREAMALTPCDWSAEELLQQCNQELFLEEAEKQGLSEAELEDMQRQWNSYIGLSDSAAWQMRECSVEGPNTTIYSAIIHELPMNAETTDTLAAAVSAQYKYWQEHGDVDYFGGVDESTPPCYQVKAVAINASQTDAKIRLVINGADFGVHELSRNVFLLPVDSSPITADAPVSVEVQALEGDSIDPNTIFVYLASNISGAR